MLLGFFLTAFTVDVFAETAKPPSYQVLDNGNIKVTYWNGPYKQTGPNTYECLGNPDIICIEVVITPTGAGGYVVPAGKRINLWYATETQPSAPNSSGEG